MTTTAEKLNLAPEQYDEMMIETYMRWCESVTINNVELQKVLSNSAIDRWYMAEFAKCEEEFNQIISAYDLKRFKPSEIHKIYADCTFRMYNIRPMALLNVAKKQKGTRVKGVPVLTLNLN